MGQARRVRGVLGVPTDDETYKGDEVSQTFSGGQVVWNRKTNVFATTPPELAEQLAGLDVPGDATTAIATARRAAGGPLGPLGAADGPQYAIGSDGTGQKYAGGTIFYSPKTGADVLTGQVLAKYESVGGPQGDLGLPTSDENDGGIAPMSRIASFAAADQPVIFWTPDFGAVIVRGAMNAAWTKLGGATGPLGAPTADQTESDGLVTQKFSGGAISWNRSTKAFTTEPASLQSQLAGLVVPGADVPQAPPAAGSPSDRNWFRPSSWWLLGIVPVLVLVGVVTAAVVRKRRRRADRAPLEDFENDDYENDDYDYDGDGDFDSGPMAVEGYFDHGDDHDHDHPGDHDHDHDDVHGDDHGAARERRSGWAMPADEHADLSQPERGEGRADGFQADLSADQDAIDTTPTPIVAEPGTPEAPWFSDLDEPADAAVSEHEPDAEPEPSVAAAGYGTRSPTRTGTGQRTAQRSPRGDPTRRAGGPRRRRYASQTAIPSRPRRATRSKPTPSPGLYWTPGTGGYDDCPTPKYGSPAKNSR